MALALVQNKNSESNASSVTGTVTVTSTGTGNLLVVGIAANDATRTVSGVADTKNTYVQFPSAYVNVSSGTTQMCDVWYCSNSVSGAVTVTVTYSGTAGTFFKDLWFWEISGYSNVAVDSANTITPGTGVSATDTGATVVTTSTFGFGVGIVATSGFIGTNPKAGNEFTTGGAVQATTGNAACSLLTAVAGSHTPAWTDDSAAATFCSTTAFFKDTFPVIYMLGHI